MSLAETVVQLVEEALAGDEDTPAVTVFDNVVDPNADTLPLRYAVVYIATPRAFDGDVGETPNGRHVAWRVICCSATPGDQRWEATHMAERVRDYLTARRLIPGGQKVKHDTSQIPAQNEQIVSRVVIEANDSYTAMC